MNKITLTLIVMLIGVATANAQTQRSGNDNTRVMQQLQQVTAERSRLQQENDAMKKELETLKTKYAKVSGDQSALQQRAHDLEVSSNRQQTTSKDNAEALERTRTQLQELIAKFRETATTLKTVETDREQIKTKLEIRDREFNTCVDRNAGLYFLNDEILRQLEDRSLWHAVSEKEPFTRITRTRLENLIDDYRDRVEELRVSRKTVASTH